MKRLTKISCYKYIRQICKTCAGKVQQCQRLASPTQLKQEPICSCDLFNTSMERAQHTRASVYPQSPAAAASAAPAVPSDPPRVMAAASAEPVPAAGLPAVWRPAISRKSCALSQPRCTRICKLWIISRASLLSLTVSTRANVHDHV